MTYEEYTPEKWAKKYDNGEINHPVLKLKLDEEIYKCYVKDFYYGTIVMAKILTKTRKDGKVMYAIVFEHLDKVKDRWISRRWITKEAFDRKVIQIMAQIDHEHPNGGSWIEAKMVKGKKNG